MKCVEVYKELYHQEPFDVAFCPYRISPLGAHIDHQYGKINGLAIDKGIHMAYHPKQNGVVELQSLNFPKRAQFFVSAVPEEKQGDWADHLRGAAKMLGEKYRLKVGLSGIIEGSLPIGGLSSSASVIICFLSALCKVNGIHLKPMEMILTAKAAENQYVGVSCGKLDQSCEVLSKKNHLLYLDTKDDSYELIPTSEKMKPYKVAIFFSGLERSLKNSKYNLRQDECKAAAYALMGYAGMLNMALMGAYQIVTALFGFVLPSMILNTYGASLHGYTTTVSNIMSYVALVNAGLAPAAVQALYTPLAKKDTYRLNQVLNAIDHFYTVSGCLYTIAIAIIASVLPFVLSNQLPPILIVLLMIYPPDERCAAEENQVHCGEGPLALWSQLSGSRILYRNGVPIFGDSIDCCYR